MSQSKVSMSKVAGASFIGALIEWYDFFLYGTASAIVFNKLFFPNFDPLVGTIASFATFGAGFIARPVGGIIFGHYGDRIGRKAILILTLLMMGGSTFLIGLLPTYNSIGLWAPVLLVALRLFQGIGLGGEYGGAALLTIEHAPRRKRGFWGGLVQAATSGGLLLATIVFSLVSLLPEAAFLSWGWRLPFLISFVLLGVGTFIRLKVNETPAFEKVKETGTEAKFPVLELFRSYPRSVLLTIGARLGESVTANITNAFAISYLTTRLGLPKQDALNGILLAAAVAMVLSPFFGSLSDRVGRRPVYLGGALFLVLFTVPYFLLLNAGSMGLIWLALVLGYVGSTVMLSVQSVYFTEMFGVRVRYSGLSIVYQLSSVMGGFTPLIATYLLTAGSGSPWLVAGFSILTCVISFVSVLLTKETFRADIAEDEEAGGDMRGAGVSPERLRAGIESKL
ncbi:MFS transporter [Paenibacillus sp. J31TS4]|uniref:MFS transporter n=1 Tax=Paenibacillus sp. J31TS4 TaxID=2807195 RepID=UPI001B11A241|nr:MFS transporter [Paenibacillus sp. J31TS4]GIP36949.1 MFS transporter [Paenibacillus sp. J31TS4]